MAFCSNCGTNLNGQSVCPGCGTPAGQTIAVAGNTSVIQGAPKSDRSMALAQLDDVITHFCDVEDDYNLFLKDSAELGERKKKATLAWLFAIPVIWIVGIIVGGITPIGHSVILGSIYILLLLILPIVLPIRAKIKNVKAIKRLDKEISELVDKIVQHYYSYEGEMPIGFEYYNTDDLYSLRNMLTSGRATNIPQAINLLLDDRHKQTMELEAMLTRYAAEAAAAYSRDASVHARSAAQSAANAEMFSAGAYYNTK